MRPANIVTAFADIFAGFAAAGGIIILEYNSIAAIPPELGWLLLSTLGLYGGGVVFNDVFDAELDAEERPERAIPSGRVSKPLAILQGSVLLIIGIATAFTVNYIAGFLAFGIACFALAYDYWAKYSSIWGPLFMGICRGGNLLLGSTVFPFLLKDLWFLALLPITYIGAITLISQGEVHGGDKASGYIGLSLVLLVSGALLLLGVQSSYDTLVALPFVLVFGMLIIPPFIRAALKPKPQLIKIAVKRGVLSLILLNSALVAGYAGWIMGVITALLLPLSLLLAKLFEVT
jgi:4-hydroxybenzoate polyprenyltransferase